MNLGYLNVAKVNYYLTAHLPKLLVAFFN